ncbi:Nucleotide-binding universal stress protein, UspA family [Maribacter dokdonensis]|uniref:Nucleotide-binding universal stress protein, UspA family n=1 Tax=Maribacter dokdonensis TaxID=320912 RepID=A0ABY0U649_9FLAO|nr:universal stress protein [Maribacter dokdonensis]SDS13207.1 Nucleotide-binding universal stress protein, UspA family [Maribacter dokdonensis]
MTRILLSTDFSENALTAIRYALTLYKDLKCTFFLLNSYMPPVYHTEYLIGSPAQIGLGDIVQQNSQDNLEALKNTLEKEFNNPLHTFITHSALNVLSSEITRTVEAEKIDIIVMGTQGASGAKEILLGTNTVHVIKNAKCPVLVIPSGFEYEAPEQILFPNDFEVWLDKKSLEQLLKITHSHISLVNVMHVYTGDELNPIQEKNKEQLAKVLSESGFFHEVPSNEVIAAINEFQIKQKINLLVMIQNKHTFFERLFIEPVIKKIGFDVTVPFLVIPQ